MDIQTGFYTISKNVTCEHIYLAAEIKLNVTYFKERTLSKDLWGMFYFGFHMQTIFRQAFNFNAL